MAISMFNMFSARISCCLLAYLVVYVAAQCDEVCYPNVECFDNCAPFTQFPLPKSPEYIGTKFQLYTRNNMNNPEAIDVDNLGSNFNGNRPKTMIVTHGFAGSGEDGWIISLKNEMLQNTETNFIAIDWEVGASPDPDEPLTQFPASNSRVVGRLTRNLIRALVSQKNLRLQDVHLVGFSVGAHATAFIAKEFTSPKIGRLSGLDPAGIVFEMADPRGRIDKSDAVFVDAIHTNSRGVLVSSGIDRVVGDVDFWPNQGMRQPGCVELGELLEDTCSHTRATDFFVESVNSNCRFNSNPCASYDDMREGNCTPCSGPACTRMGYHTSLSATGNFDLTTNSSPPFCLN